MGAKPLVFFHVMKCGGTSVRAGLATSVAGRRRGPEIFELDGAIAKIAAGGANADDWMLRDALLPYVLLAMEPKVVLGHFRYRDRYAELAADAHFVTVLRDPVDRLVSLYKWRRYKEGISNPISQSFEQLVGSGRWRKNGRIYVDTFCGDDSLDPRSDAAIDAAVANLLSFAVVGFIDRIDDFASQVAARVGTPVSFPVLNRSPAPKGSEISPEVLEQARALCAPDYGVYDKVRAALT